MKTSDQSQIAYARLAGFMYLFVDVAYMAGMSIIGRFIVAGNAAATGERIIAAESLYRTGLASTFLGALCTVFLAIGLYGTLKAVNKDLALFAFAFRLVEAVVFAVGSIFSFVVFMKLYIAAGRGDASAAHLLSVFAGSGGATSSPIFNIAAIFFSIGSILFFYLFLKTNYIPRVLSVLGLVGSALVPIIGFGILIFPQRGAILQFGWIPIGVAEIVVGFLLLIKGVNLQPRDSGYAVVA